MRANRPPLYSPIAVLGGLDPAPGLIILGWGWMGPVSVTELHFNPFLVKEKRRQKGGS